MPEVKPRKERTFRGLKKEATQRAVRHGHVLRSWPETNTSQLWTSTLCITCQATVIIDIHGDRHKLYMWGPAVNTDCRDWIHKTQNGFTALHDQLSGQPQAVTIESEALGYEDDEIEPEPEPDLEAGIPQPEWRMDWDPLTASDGYIRGLFGLNIHLRAQCNSPCPFHGPSDHAMKLWPIAIRKGKDYVFVDRICRHGVGHPDPDRLLNAATIHGCCPEKCCA